MTTNTNTRPLRKDMWEILRTLAAVFASVAGITVPFLIAWIGAEYNQNIKDSENRVKYVELAIAQLHSPPSPETSALRDWAVELLDSQAPVKLSSAAKAQLKTNVLAGAASITGRGIVSANGVKVTGDTAAVRANAAITTNGKSFPTPQE